jgi:ABC-type sulfate transport system permease component
MPHVIGLSGAIALSLMLLAVALAVLVAFRLATRRSVILR